MSIPSSAAGVFAGVSVGSVKGHFDLHGTGAPQVSKVFLSVTRHAHCSNWAADASIAC